ncbi:uncharacterized protein METZ01_LOCUS256570, partial [marine metagenome]
VLVYLIHNLRQVGKNGITHRTYVGLAGFNGGRLSFLGLTK